jgi:hypothetical protein
MSRKKNARPRPKKRPYHVPALKRYGDLRTLTMGKGGLRVDTGMPKTRTGGTP